MRAALFRARETWRQWGGRTWPWLLLLVIAAACYYGSYYRYEIAFKDEGGTEVLVGDRLLHGERPFVDVDLGYNVLWFYPIVALFKLGGVSYLHLRVYCFVLSTIAAMAGFGTVRRAGGPACLAFAVGLVMTLVPGMTFKNYMPFLVATNSLLLVNFALAGLRSGEARTDVRVDRRSWLWLALGGVWLGVTYLMRVDLGIFFTLLWVGGCLLRGMAPETPIGRGLALRLGGPVLVIALAFAMHYPVYLDAKQRGFAGPFVQQYAGWVERIAGPVEHLLGHSVPAATPVPKPSAEKKDLAAAPGSVAPQVGHETLHRKTLADWRDAKNFEQKLLILLLYAPILVLGWLALWALLRLKSGWFQRDPEAYVGALGALLLIGGALTDFPQYFFFRPDGPHLSEFSPGYWAATVGAILLLATTGIARARTRTVAAALAALLVTAHAAVYLWTMMPDRWTGTIAARHIAWAWGKKSQRMVLFNAENGVNVFVTQREFEAYTEMLKTIREHSKADDYLIAYPYHPSINVLANRRTYEKNVYVDNAIAPPTWNRDAIARLEKYKPAVVVLSDWAVNSTDDSRFSVWAAPTKEWIQQHYTLQGTYLEFEVYTLGQ